MPTIGGMNADILEQGMLPCWEYYTKWQNKAMISLIDENKYDVIFSHIHNVDICAHVFYRFAIYRKHDPEIEVERYPQFMEKGAVILGVSKDSVASHKRFEEKYGLAFTLLSDPERTVIEAYDVWKEKKLYGKVSMGVVRTTYLIDEHGIIVKANDKVKAADDPEKLLQELS